MSKINNYIIIILLILSFNIAASDWEVIGEMPIPVKGAQAVVHDSLIYIIGGYTDSIYNALNKIQVYNPKLDSWSIIEDTLAMRRYGHVSTNYGQNLAIFGGAYTPSEFDQSLEIWNFMSNPVINNYNPNFDRIFATGQIYAEKLYIFGGYSNNTEIDSTGLPYLIEYNIPLDSITYQDMATYSKDNLPIDQMSTLLEDYIYIFGGSSFGITKDIHKFHVNSHSWELLALPMIVERAGGQSVRVDEKSIVLLGGYNENQQALSSVELFRNWSHSYYENEMAEPLNYARAELAAVFLDSFVYVFGGRDALDQCIPYMEKWKPEPHATSLEHSKNLNMKRLYRSRMKFCNKTAHCQTMILLKFIV